MSPGPSGTKPRKENLVPSDSPIAPGSSPSSFDATHMFQSLLEIQKDLAVLNGRSEHLTAELSEIKAELSGIKRLLHKAQGFGFAAILLIPAFAALIWWLIGGEITQIRDQVMKLPVASASSSAVPVATPATPATSIANQHP